jgi:hypothetical protein
MKNQRLSPNFSLSEFQVGWDGGGVIYPYYSLLHLLQLLRDEIKNPIKITSGARSFNQHLKIYAGKAKPPNSRHLPSFNTTKLRAVDITQNVCTYQDLKTIILRLRDTHMADIPLGIGVSNNFLHLDIDRKKDTFWSYNGSA